MGDEADDVLTSFGLTEEDKNDYKTVKEKFNRHFITRRNIIWKRARFNSHAQGNGEGVESYITALYGLVEHCNYRDLCEKMIRD